MQPREITEKIDHKSTRKLYAGLYQLYAQKQPLQYKEELIEATEEVEPIGIDLSLASLRLGILFLNGFNDFLLVPYHYYLHSHTEAVDSRQQRYQAFLKYDLENLWDGEHFQLLRYLFGEEKAPLIKKVWSELPQLPYQTGFYRRSFRSPNHLVNGYVSQLNFIINYLGHGNNHPFSITESIQYDNVLEPYTRGVSHIWAMAVDEGRADVYQTMIDILTGKAEVGKVSKNIIKALLLSNKPEAWEQVGKLLLAAQRQEGLRQTILECLDFTSKGAMEYMMNLVLEHNLIRFSSVVRALDTWAGFGWSAEKQSTVKRFMSLGYTYIKNPELIETAIKSEDNAEVYMSLWGAGTHDIFTCYPYLECLYEKGTLEKKILVLYFVQQAGLPVWQQTFGELALQEDNSQLHYWALQFINARKVKDKEAYFNRLLTLYKGFESKEITSSCKVFSWSSFTYTKEQLENKLINAVSNSDTKSIAILLDFFDKMSVSNRESLTRKILKEYYENSSDKDKKRPELTKAQRDFAFRILKDRSSNVRDSGMRALKQAKLSEDEIQVFEGLLTRKSAEFRQYVLEMIQKRGETEIFDSAARLIVAKNVEQRLAGLDLLNYLSTTSEQKARVRSLAIAYAERPKIGRKEQILLANLLVEEQVEYNTENGFGLYNPSVVTVAPLPQSPTEGEYYERHIKGQGSNGVIGSITKAFSSKKSGEKVHPYGLSMSLEKVQTHLDQLKTLYLANKDFEYEYEEWDNTRHKVLLGNTFASSIRNDEKLTAREKFENYPLAHVWEEWYKTAQLTPFDLFLILESDQRPKESPELFLKTFDNIKTDYPVIPLPLVPTGDEYWWEPSKNASPLHSILLALSIIYPYEERTAYLIGGATHLLSKIDDSELSLVCEEKLSYYTEYHTVFSMGYFNDYLRVDMQKLTDDLFTKIWYLKLFIYQHVPDKKVDDYQPRVQDYCRAYVLNLCTEDEIVARIMQPDAIRTLTEKFKKAGEGEVDWRLKYEFLIPMVEKAKERILEIELKRGDSGTSATKMAQNIQSIYGIDYFVQLLNALDKDTLNRGYIYSYGDTEYSKKEVLSTLLKRCYPFPNETYEEFDKKLAIAKFTEKRLVEVGLYSQQWLPFIAKFLDWDALEAGAWWLHAHTNSYHNAETESEVAKYSSIKMRRFRDGAVDYEWFNEIYKRLGKARWKILYDAAKYISDGTGHSRAKLYAAVMTGETKIREVTKRVKEKRNKDYVRVYGLVPLSKKTPDKDVLSRYNYLLQFKKESRQFGAQRQESEGLAVKIALENLARTAGYPDPIRLTWAMETEEAKTIMANAKALEYDDYTIRLEVNEFGKSRIVTKRKDKEIKNVPAKLSKEKDILELKSFHKRLKEQYSRSRKSLETAMVRGDQFRAKEIRTLSEHPVIAPMLSALVLINGDKKIGFYRGGQLVNQVGEQFPLGDNIRIAHCTDFYYNGDWSALQQYCFAHKIVQPFKQIFRELYVPTEDELQEKSLSRRYAGHQVQPTKTVALLKARGWTVDYEEGLQKVFHKLGIIAKMYAMADWFSPADVESPTLETVQFINRNTYEKVPFEDLSPLIFSEIMRDIDLVVSVAHVGGVDPEASMSTVALRTAILTETCRLFKLDNVRIEGHHAHITGQHGEYSVHLGSAVTHLKPGKYLSILPVHSQHRGRIFLPFVDEDPRTAELMSKILLLAKDDDIQDPTILRQIGMV